jgi:hypothetical protein
MPFRLSTVAVLAFVFFSACKNEAPTSTSTAKDPTRGSAETMGSQCTLSRESLLGFQIGDTIDVKVKKYKFKLTPEKYKTGDGEFDIYTYKTPSGEILRIFPLKKGGVEKVHLLEYTGAMCQTSKGVGVSSTLSALLKAYPDLEVHGSEVEGRTMAKGGEWYFLLGTNVFTPNVDIKTLNQDIRVTAVVLQ